MESLAVGIICAVIGAIIWEISREMLIRLKATAITSFTPAPNLNGIWTSEFIDRGRKMNERVDIRSTGSYGEAISEVTIDGSFYKKYKFKGKVKDRIINLRYENVDPSTFEQGSIVLQLMPDGCLARGTYVYLADDDPDLDDIVAIPYYWKRADR